MIQKILHIIINLIKNNKKKIIIGIISFLIGIILFIKINNNYRKNIFIELFNNTSNKVITILNNKTISGNTKIKINLKGMYSKNEIIKDMDYSLDYQIDLKESYINIDGKTTYNNNKITNNIYIYDNLMNIKIPEIYNKYITIPNNKLTILNNISEYKDIITILNKEINKVLKTKHFNYSIVKINNKKINKTTLNLTKKNNIEIKKEIQKDLLNNKKFIKSLSNILNISNKKTKEYIKEYDITNTNFSISIYTNKFSNELVKIELNIEEENLIINKQQNKYSFKYYVRDGLLYDGYIKIKNNNKINISLNNILDLWNLNIEVKEITTKYNKEFNKQKTIKNNQITSNNRVIDKLKENDIFNDFYNKYLDREEVYTPPDGPEEPIDLYEEQSPIID